MGKDLTQQTVSGLIWKFAERIGAQLVTAIISIVLARILLPEDYGVVSIVTILITICNVFVSNGFGNSLIQKKDVDEADFSSVFYASLVLSVGLYAILFFAAPYIARFYKNDLLSPVLRVMGLRVPIAAVNSVQQAYVSREMAFRKFFFATLIGTLVSGAVGLYMAYSGYGVWALVGQYLTNVTIDTVMLWITVKWRPKRVFSFKKLKGLLAYGWKLLVSGLLDTGYNELRSLVIGKKYSSADLAYYDKGKQFPSLIAVNVNASFNSVLFSAMSKVQDDREKVKQVTRKSIRVSSYILMPCMMGLAVVAEPFVRVLLTDKWLAAVPYLQIMCVVYAFYPIHTANLTAISAVGRSDLFLILEIVKKVVGIVSLLISMWFGVIWIALTAILTTLISSFINAFPNKKLLGYGYLEQVKDLLPAIGLSVLMGVPVYLMNFIPMNVYALLCLQVLAGVAIYLAASIAFKSESFGFILGYVKRVFNKKGTGKEKMKEEKTKKLMLLGGSRYLLPVIEAAHDLGLYVITCDYLPKNIAHRYSDQYINISIIDKEAVLEAAKENEISGIMSFATDPGVVTAAYVAEKLGLPACGPYESVCILQNKARFRSFLSENGFNVPKARGYTNIEEALKECNDFNWPIIVKPVDSAGSKGVARVDREEDLRACIENALNFSQSRAFILEEFIERKGCSSDSDCFSIEGKLGFVSFSSQWFDEKADNPYTPSAYSWPSTFSKESEVYLKNELQRLLSLLNMRTSIYNIETREGTDGKAYIMEASPRGGGNRLSEMLRHATGVDLIKNAVRAAVGFSIQDMEQKSYDGYWAEYILHAPNEGIFKSLEIDTDFEQKYVVQNDVWVKEGDTVKAFTGANETIGTLILKFDSLDEMLYEMNHFEKKIKIDLD